MGAFEKLADHGCWLEFYEHRKGSEEVCDGRLGELYAFISEKKYISYAGNLKEGESFSVPKKLLVNKSSAGKKRTVYTFTKEETFVLSMLAFLLKDYDGLFAPNLYSFRKNKTAKAAFRSVAGITGAEGKYVYRCDISSYFNSVNVAKFLPKLKKALSDDEPLFDFFQSLLTDRRVLFGGEIQSEEKGIIPGCPAASFFANLYLSDLDFYFYDKGIDYIRYSDDILVMADSEKELSEYIGIIHKALAELELSVNKDKESVHPPMSQWEFLGFSYNKGTVDISQVSLKKIKAKMKRKARALRRWAEKNNHPAEYAARAFIKRFNAKFYNNPVYNELTWSRWYFPVITTTDSLEIIDRYEVDLIRYILSGRHTKKRYDYKYEQIKKLGFRSLVNEYYKSKEEL